MCFFFFIILYNEKERDKFYRNSKTLNEYHMNVNELYIFLGREKLKAMKYFYPSLLAAHTLLFYLTYVGRFLASQKPARNAIYAEELHSCV